MGREQRRLQHLCLLAAVLCGCSGALAKNIRWERVLQGGAGTAIGGAPAAALQEPPMGLGTPAHAPAPAPAYGPPAAPIASDALAETNTTINQLQTLGTHQSDHVAPPSAVAALLNGSTYQQALGANPKYAPASLQYTLPDIFFQLENLGIRQFHFNAWKDPNGTLARHPAGLKLAGVTNETLDPKYTYFGYKTFGDPDFDYRSSCVTLETCLRLIQSWSVNHTDHIPITIYLQPREDTLLAGNEAPVNALLQQQPGPPSALAQAYPIGAADLIELQNTVYRVFNQSDIVLPGSLLGNATSLQAATQSGSGGNWPTLDSVRGRFMFVLQDTTGKYGPLYRARFPDLRSATFFVSQPGGNATIDPSTVFLDFLGPLGGDSVQTWSNTSANAATARAAQQITSAVRRGFLTRAAADWNTIEAREGYNNRTYSDIRAGAQFIQTSFPDASLLPAYAYSVKGTNNNTLFYSPNNYTASLPLRLGMSFTAGRCDPQTSAGVIANETATGCGNPANNAALSPSASLSF